MYGTYVVLQSIMFERSCLFPNILVDKFTCTSQVIVIVEKNAQQLRPFLHTYILQKCV